MASGEYLVKAINDLHMAASERQDAEGVAVVTKCLAALTALQQKDHSSLAEGKSAMQTVLQRAQPPTQPGY